MEANRKRFSSTLLWLALLLIVLASYGAMRKARTRFVAAEEQLQQCTKLAEEIQAFQDRPGFAALGVDSPRTITTRAEEAVVQANIGPASLARIEPQAAVRLRDSAYRIRPTRLELRRVTLEQVLRFTHAMIDEAQGTTVRDIRLTATDGSSQRNGSSAASGSSGSEESWTAELVLTQLIFSPLRR